MKRLTLVLGVVLLSGCSHSDKPRVQLVSADTLGKVQAMVAQQLGKSTSEIDPDQTFAAAGADDLDLVEITLLVEDKLGVAISDDSLISTAGVSDPNSVRTKLTVRQLAALADRHYGK